MWGVGGKRNHDRRKAFTVHVHKDTRSSGNRYSISVWNDSLDNAFETHCRSWHSLHKVAPSTANKVS